MLEPLSSQTVCFLCSILFGAALGALYDAVRLLRSFSCRRWVQNLADILFFFSAGILTSLFSLPLNRGIVRYFVIVGEIIGFVLFLLTLGRLTQKLWRSVFGILRKIFQIICNLLKKFYVLLLKFMRFVVYNVVVIIEKLHHTMNHNAENLPKRGKNERKKRKEGKSENKKSNRPQKRFCR